MPLSQNRKIIDCLQPGWKIYIYITLVIWKTMKKMLLISILNVMSLLLYPTSLILIRETDKKNIERKVYILYIYLCIYVCVRERILRGKYTCVCVSERDKQL